jgi:hypothetical protein
MKKVIIEPPDNQVILAENVSEYKFYLVDLFPDSFTFTGRYGLLSRMKFDSRDWHIHCFDAYTKCNVFSNYKMHGISLKEVVTSIINRGKTVYEFDNLFELSEFILKHKK